MIAFITDNSKKTGSKYFPSTLIMFFGGKGTILWYDKKCKKGPLWHFKRTHFYHSGFVYLIFFYRWYTEVAEANKFQKNIYRVTLIKYCKTNSPAN